ncbi:MAG: hypothetical protein VR65_26745 [Desulfobulbaceae bacterium BRH_c16a]|nr:MAG: hypothetical protein VR65_26745 [Desulfobulbaceae bacterium BRH_c16a]
MTFRQIPRSQAHAKKPSATWSAAWARRPVPAKQPSTWKTEDSTVGLAKGDKLFLERTLTASLTGPPNLPF